MPLFLFPNQQRQRESLSKATETKRVSLKSNRDKEKEWHSGIETERQQDSKTERQRDRETARQRDSKTERQRNKETYQELYDERASTEIGAQCDNAVPSVRIIIRVWRTRVRVYLCVCVCVRACACACACVCVRVCMCACVYTYIYVLHKRALFSIVIGAKCDNTVPSVGHMIRIVSSYLQSTPSCTKRAPSHTKRALSYTKRARGGGLGSSTIFKNFNEPYAPS